MSDATIDESRILAITRPHPYLLIQYFLWSLSTIIPVALVPLFFRYYTLRYRIDSEGISMRWGFLFHREINLTYARIQDIHLSRGLIERWLGLGTLSIQTASGSAGAEMVIPGLTQYDELRDFLYQRMRGHRYPSRPESSAIAAGGAVQVVSSAQTAEALLLLQQIHEDLQAIRRHTSLQDNESSHGERGV